MALLDNPSSSLLDGRKVVSSAGTAVALASATSVNEVAITALDSNSGTIVVGASTVKAKAEERRGQPLVAGQTVSFGIRDLASVYIDATSSGDGVSFVAGLA